MWYGRTTVLVKRLPLSSVWADLAGLMLNLISWTRRPTGIVRKISQRRQPRPSAGVPVGSGSMLLTAVIPY